MLQLLMAIFMMHHMDILIIFQKIQHMICLIGLMKMVIIELALKLYVTIVMMSMEQILQDIGILIFTN